MNGAAVEVQDLTVGYGDHIAVANLTASLPRGQVTAVIGPNGSGKSTLLKSILGLLPLRKGRIRVLGKPFPRVRHRVAYVPQKEEVDWHYPLLVWEAVAMGRCYPGKILRPLTAGDHGIINEAMARLELLPLRERPVGQLSGGQKQRVFLARALAREADLYLLDEPFSGVDAATEEEIRRQISLLKEQEKTVVIVHHKLEEVYQNFDWTLLLNREVISFGPTREVFNLGTMETVFRGLFSPKPEPVKEHQPCTTW